MVLTAKPVPCSCSSVVFPSTTLCAAAPDQTVRGSVTLTHGVLLL